MTRNDLRLMKVLSASERIKAIVSPWMWNSTPLLHQKILFHGTVDKFLEPIRQSGLLKMSRQHVHLSADLKTAQNVGSRRGNPIILTVRSGDMHREGHTFFLSENGVWLVGHVPAQFIGD